MSAMRPMESSGRAALMTALGPRLAIAALLATGALLLAGCFGGGDSKHGATAPTGARQRLARTAWSRSTQSPTRRPSTAVM